MKYPSSILNNGGLSLSGEGNMNTQEGSSMTSYTSYILLMALIRDCTRLALLALYLNLSINYCIWSSFSC